MCVNKPVLFTKKAVDNTGLSLYICNSGLFYIRKFYRFARITLQGLPAAITLSGISLVTILPAPITTLSPIVTPGKIIAPPPIHTLFPMITGAVCVLQNSNEPSSFGSPKRVIASVDCCQFVDPFVAFEAQEYGQTFKDLIGLHGDYYKFYRQLPVECSQEGQWHYDAPDGNQVQIHRKFGISATLDDTDSDRHLIRHSNHDHAHNNHEVVCI